MGFFDALKKAGSGAANAIQQTASEVEEYKSRMEYYSDDQLFREIRSGSYAKKSACSILLQERGYSRDEVATAMKGNR